MAHISSDDLLIDIGSNNSQETLDLNWLVTILNSYIIPSSVLKSYIKPTLNKIEINIIFFSNLISYVKV